jgi:glycosyltransferase involved in cell wall biosynthesis
MSKPPIDILLAVYNGERYLRPLLDSLVAQSFRDFRLVVSDNKSTDATVSILDSYRGKLAEIVVLPPPPETTPSLLNFARVTEASDALYVMYADADDVWHADKVEKTFAAMQKAEREFGADKPLLVHSDLVVVDENLKPLHDSFWRYQLIDPRRTRLKHLLLQNCVTGCTTMLNRPLLELIKPIPPESRVHDWWIALAASAFGQIVMVEEPLIEYRQHGGNVTGAKSWSLRFVVDRARRLYSPSGVRQNLAPNITQAQAFLARFGDRLTPSDKHAVREFATIQRRKAVSRRWVLIRNGFWKFGLARNIGLLLGI